MTFEPADGVASERTDVSGHPYREPDTAHRAGLHFRRKMTILDFGTTDIASSAALRAGVAMIQLHDELWRVTRTNGEVLGYVERFSERGGWRFRAKRMLVSQRRFIAVGEFWTIGEAVDCFG